MIEDGWVRDLLIVLATAGVLVPLLARLRVGVVPGFLIAGMLLGPYGLGRFDDYAPWIAWITFAEPDRVAPFADLGVVFLLFVIGLEFSLSRLWTMRRLVFGVGSAQFRMSVPFYLTAILFIIFDLEAAFLFTWAIAIREAVQQGKLVRMVLGDAYLKYYRSPEYYRSAGWR